jgi:uncharacterized membrane protein YphA (DoxX/SURF4 family)
LNSTAATESKQRASRDLNPIAFARGMAVIRIFFGLILFTNGLAKVNPEWGQINVGAYHANLITQSGARGILNFEVNQRQIRKNAPKGTQVPCLKRFVNGFVLENWGIFKYVVTWTELLAGGALILGLASRLAASVDLSMQLFLALVYFSSNRWAFEQPHEYVPLIVLGVVPAGRAFGLDGVLIRRNPKLRRWPF